MTAAAAGGRVEAVIRAGLLTAAFLVLVPLAAGEPADLPLEPCKVAGIDARCGRFVVPENRQQPEGRTISLLVVVVPARDGGSARDPIVHITGGPGAATSADAAGMASIFAPARAHRDIVLVDQRGTGGSNPLACPPPPKGTIIDLTKPNPATVGPYVRACFAALKGDARQYTTAPAMDDLAEVVAALGYGRINLYGVSYGATAAQYFLAQHPELVRTAILDGGTLLDVPIFERWGANGQRALRLILARCADSKPCARSFPRARSEVFEAIAALRKKPVRSQGIRLDAATAAGAIQWLSRSPSTAAEIPWIAHRARVGDWAPLAQTVVRQQQSGSVNPRQVMFWSIVCNEPWARWNPGRTAAASRTTYLAERTAIDARAVATACSFVPKVAQPTWSAGRVDSDAPVLLVVGGADPQDPLANVAGASRELPNSRTVVVPAGGHGSVQLGCMPQLANRFVERGTATGLDTRCIRSYAPPPFVTP